MWQTQTHLRVCVYIQAVSVARAVLNPLSGDTTINRERLCVFAFEDSCMLLFSFLKIYK